MKRFLEMRGADGGPWGRLCALPAVWVGLLYDDTALNAAWDLAKDWSMAQREALRREVPRVGLAGEIEGLNVLELAREVVKIADAGLKARGRQGAISNDETEYLLPLKQIVEEGRSPAQALLDAYESRWDGSVDPVYAEQAY